MYGIISLLFLPLSALLGSSSPRRCCNFVRSAPVKVQRTLPDLLVAAKPRHVFCLRLFPTSAAAIELVVVK